MHTWERAMRGGCINGLRKHPNTTKDVKTPCEFAAENVS